jgi:hypothetical protein
MPDKREIINVYAQSEEGRQLDMWLLNRELRLQFDTIDPPPQDVEIRRSLPEDAADTSTGEPQGFWRRLTKCCP